MLLSIPHCSGENSKSSYRANHLLNLLPKSELDILIAHANQVFLSPKTVICKANEPVDQVYFPLKGVISWVTSSQNGLMSDVLTIGNEGMIGTAAFLGGNCISSFATVQTDCIAISLNAQFLKQMFNKGGELPRILLLYTQFLLSEALQNVFCSCHHTIEQRLARWLILYSDLAFSEAQCGQQNWRIRDRYTPSKQRSLQKIIPLIITQETLANSLGVRRSSLSVVANKLRQQNLISYSRGRIIIQDYSALKKVACECNQLISQEYCRLLR